MNELHIKTTSACYLLEIEDKRVKISRAAPPSDDSSNQITVGGSELQFQPELDIDVLVVEAPNKGTRYQNDEKERIRYEFLGGRSVYEIARAFGRTPRAIEHQLIDLWRADLGDEPLPQDIRHSASSPTRSAAVSRPTTSEQRPRTKDHYDRPPTLSNDELRRRINDILGGPPQLWGDDT